MTLFKDKYRNETARLRTWDYSAGAYYFITICTRERAHFFGEVVDGEVELSEVGAVAQQFWTEIPQHFKDVGIDAFVIMPDHMHGIIVIQSDPIVGTRHGASPLADAAPGSGETDACVRRDVDVHGATGTRHGASLPPTSAMAPMDGANAFGPLKSGSLQAIVNQYKGAVTRWCKSNRHIEFAWQARYYDHIIRTESGLARIREYITNNPSKWRSDRANQPGSWM